MEGRSSQVTDVPQVLSVFIGIRSRNSHDTRSAVSRIDKLLHHGEYLNCTGKRWRRGEERSFEYSIKISAISLKKDERSGQRVHDCLSRLAPLSSLHYYERMFRRSGNILMNFIPAARTAPGKRRGGPLTSFPFETSEATGLTNNTAIRLIYSFDRFATERLDQSARMYREQYKKDIGATPFTT